MTPVKPQISKFKAEKSCQVNFNVLSESSRSYILAYYLSVFVVLATVHIFNLLS
jgi:hypothetical protein